MHTTKRIVMALPLADQHISEFSILAVSELWRYLQIFTSRKLTYMPLYLFYPQSAKGYVCDFVNKSFNPSSYSTCFLTAPYGYLNIRNSVVSVRDAMLHKIYRMRYFPPTSYRI